MEAAAPISEAIKRKERGGGGKYHKVDREQFEWERARAAHI